MQGPKFLTAEQLLLTTLVVKLVATAALATMLVRYRRFREILIFERRAWRDRLTFALSHGIPLFFGVIVIVIRRSSTPRSQLAHKLTGDPPGRW